MLRLPKFMSRRKRIRLMKKRAMANMRSSQNPDTTAHFNSRSNSENKVTLLRTQQFEPLDNAFDFPEITEEAKEERFSLVKGEYLPSRKFLNKEKFETFGIDAETRKILMDAEYYHYLIV